MIIGNRNDVGKSRAKREGYSGKVHRFNFVIFKNYDGSVEGKRIPRETYERIIAASSDASGL